MAFFSEESLRNGFESCKRNLTIITKFSTFFTIFVLVGVSLGMLSNKHYPLLASYALLVAIGMLVVELGLPIVARIDTSQQENMSWWKERSGTLNELLTPLKKCVIYAVVGLPLFIHMSVAMMGAILLLITALFLAGQVKYDDSTVTGDYSNLMQDDDVGPISGINSGDIVIPVPGSGSASANIDMVPDISEGNTMSKSETGWDMMKDDVNDDNLLLG